jgi:hypothetical protein
MDGDAKITDQPLCFVDRRELIGKGQCTIAGNPSDPIPH